MSIKGPDLAQVLTAEQVRSRLHKGSRITRPSCHSVLFVRFVRRLCTCGRVREDAPVSARFERLPNCGDLF